MYTLWLHICAVRNSTGCTAAVCPVPNLAGLCSNRVWQNAGVCVCVFSAARLGAMYVGMMRHQLSRMLSSISDFPLADGPAFSCHLLLISYYHSSTALCCATRTVVVQRSFVFIVICSTDDEFSLSSTVP